MTVSISFKKKLFSSVVVGILCTYSHSFTITTPSLRYSTTHTTTHNIMEHGHNKMPHTATYNTKKHVLKMIPYAIQSNPKLYIPLYFMTTNFIYICRRSIVRKMSKRKLWKIRMSRENGVSTRLYITNIITWQLFVLTIFPMLEPISRLFGYVSFYYFYPNAGGCGFIFEPVSAQHLNMSKRTKTQLRFDWHRFSVNVGDIGRDGYRHPPSVERNLPHIDMPKYQLKHWPWRRRWNTINERYIK